MIDAGFVPRPRPDVVLVELDDELVLTVAVAGDDDRFDAHRLDRTASVVWRCFDGESSLGEVADDLSDAFGASREVVLADVVALTRTLGDRGLLQGLGRDSDR